MLLDDMGFKAQAISDLVRGRLVKYSQEDTERILEQVGTLLAFSRQLDLALSSDIVANKIFEAFTNRRFWPSVSTKRLNCCCQTPEFLSLSI